MNVSVIDYRFYIRKILHYSVFAFFLLPFFASAQQELSVTNNLRSEQWRFVTSLRGIRIDTSIVYPIARYVDSEVNKLYEDVAGDASLPDEAKEKALRSTVYFMTELSRNLQLQKFDVYSIPSAFENYKQVLQALVHGRKLDRFIHVLGENESQIIAAAFTQYEEYRYLDDVAVYKRVAAAPDFIYQFLESKPGFRLADSLLAVAASHDPLRMIHYLGKGDPQVRQKIRSSTNPFIRQIVDLAGDKNAAALLPFLLQLKENGMSAQEIVTTRLKTTDYFHLLVNTLMETVRNGKNKTRYMQPLRAGIRQQAIDFYVRPVNDLHDSPEAARFAVVKGLRPEDLYYIITGAGEDLYTSSYLGLYKRLKTHFEKGNVAEIFDRVQYDNFHVFMRLAANYNTLADFLSAMPREDARNILHRYISSISADPGAGVETAMDIADSFGALTSVPEFVEMAGEELKLNLSQVRARHQYLGMRLYNILSQVFNLVREDGNADRVWAKLGNYELLKQNQLSNRKGEIVEVVLFYGDEDGVASFKNFMKLYDDSNHWQVKRSGKYVNIRSRSGTPVSIFANLPLDISEGLDLAAQDTMFYDMKKLGLEPTILVHRGHSYHLEKTLNKLRPSVNLAILGSCGGYNKAISIASINPDVHIIGSKKTGAMSVNDPLLETINDDLAAGKDLSWKEVWAQLNARFSSNPAAAKLFSEYFPPDTNIGLFVLKLFRQNRRDI